MDNDITCHKLANLHIWKYEYFCTGWLLLQIHHAPIHGRACTLFELVLPFSISIYDLLPFTIFLSYFSDDYHEDDEVVENQFGSYWINFAHTCTPSSGTVNLGNFTGWPQYSSDEIAGNCGDIHGKISYPTIFSGCDHSARFVYAHHQVTL